MVSFTSENTSLRKYQIRMCEAAKDQNSIVVMPTGSGKTVIAAALAKWNTLTKNGKTLFLVPTQMLVEQQSSAIQSNTRGLRVACYHGELNWPRGDYDVLVSTPEAFKMKLASSEASFSHFTFVVFDEVHHVMKRHPYRKLARLLELEKTQPTILGLTATCTYAVGESQIESDITKLCEALSITVILSANPEELVRDGYHGATPKLEISTTTTPKETGTTTANVQSGLSEEDVIDVFDETTKGDSKFMPHQSREMFFHSIRTREADPLLLKLMDLTRSVENSILKTTPSFTSPLDSKGKPGKVSAWATYASNLRGVPQAAVLTHLYEALRLMVVTLSMDLVLEYLRMTVEDAHYRCLGSLGSILRGILVDGNIDVYTKRFSRLKGVLVKQLAAHGNDFRGILFVQQRLTTHILQYFIERTPDLARFHVACIYATSSEASPTLRVTPSQSKERIKQFSEGRVNLLISTAVAEEGMDVPAANCIIRFDPILTPVSFVQGRGRARQEKSSFVVMDERKDRSVEHLAEAERTQISVIKRKGTSCVLNTEEVREKRLKAQENRERSARQWLSTAQGNAVGIVKTFCNKSEQEIVETETKTGNEWKVIVSVHGIRGEKIQAEAVCSTKKEAKRLVFENLLTLLRHSKN